MSGKACSERTQGVAISERGRQMPASPIRKLIPYADRAKQRGVKVYHLNIGQPDVETPAEMLAGYRNLTLKVIEYGPSVGLYQYVRGLVGYYQGVGIKIVPADILVTTGGSEAITFVYKAITDPLDEIIVPEPFYTNYAGYACMNNIRLIPVTCKAEQGFHLPARAEFEARITARTKAILFSNPGNPTGVVYTREELALLRQLALDHNLYLIADEVYREFIYDPDVKHQSVMNVSGLEDRAVLVDSISKRYSACGARVGCIVSRNRGLMATVLKFAQARLCPPTVDQIAALAALASPPAYFAHVRDEYRRRRDMVCDALRSMPGVLCQRPAGAFYVVTRLPVDDAEQFTIFMLDKFHLNNETVMVAPADGFYATPGAGKDEVRIAYVLNCDDLAKAMKLLAAGIEAYNSRK
jgi:aspartate aminotransferase